MLTGFSLTTGDCTPCVHLSSTLLLFMIVYVLGIYVTQVVLNETLRRVEHNESVPEELEMYT